MKIMKMIWSRSQGIEDVEICWRCGCLMMSPRHPGRRDSHGPGRHRTADQRSLNRPGRTWPDCANWETTRRQLGDNSETTWRQLSSSEVVWDPQPMNWNHMWNHMSWGKFGRSKMFLKFYCIMCLCLSQVAFCTETWLSIILNHWALINPWGFCTVTGEALARQSTGISIKGCHWLRNHDISWLSSCISPCNTLDAIWDAENIFGIYTSQFHCDEKWYVFWWFLG